MSISKLSAVRRADPFLERELKTYEQPLPSREYILQILEEQGKPVSFDALCVLLDIRKHELELCSAACGQWSVKRSCCVTARARSFCPSAPA
jgi:ribonuclease R